MGESTLGEYKQLVEEQAQALLGVIQSVALGNLDVEVELPEGVQVLSELAVGLEMMIDHLRKVRAEQKRAKEVLLKAHDETQRRLEEQIALREAGAIITSTLDQGTVLNRLAEQVCQAVDSTSAYISSYDPETTAGTVLAEYYSPEASAKSAYLTWGNRIMLKKGLILLLPVNLTNIMWTIQTWPGSNGLFCSSMEVNRY